MKKLSTIGLLLVLTVTTIFTGCKKEVDVDVSEQFLGKYAAVLNYSGDFIGAGTLTDADVTIAKTGAGNIVFIPTTIGTPTYYTVAGTTVTEVPSTTQLPIDATGNTATFKENSTGTLVNGVLTINGKWTATGYTDRTFKIVATKK